MDVHYVCGYSSIMFILIKANLCSRLASTLEFNESLGFTTDDLLYMPWLVVAQSVQKKKKQNPESNDRTKWHSLQPF